MSGYEARALAIKMLKEDDIKSVHAIENKLGRYLNPYEIISHSKDDSFSGGSIKDFWGIPDNPMAMSSYAEKLRLTIARFINTSKINVNMADVESRHNYDWHVYHGNIDLAYSAGKRPAEISVEKEEDLF